MRILLLLSLLAFAPFAVLTGSVAQDNGAQDNGAQRNAAQENGAGPNGSGTQQQQLMIELNRVQQGQDGCRLSFIAVNRLGADLESTAMEVVFFDADDIVSEMLLLDFGRLPSDKTKVVEFVLQQQECDQISRVLVNDIVECSSGEEQNMTRECFNALRTANRADIEFGV